MSAPVPLKVVGSDLEPSPAVIETAERILAAAKEGRLRGIVAMLRMSDESYDHMLVGRREPLVLIGQLHRLAHLVQVDVDAQVTEATV